MHRHQQCFNYVAAGCYFCVEEIPIAGRVGHTPTAVSITSRHAAVTELITLDRC